MRILSVSCSGCTGSVFKEGLESNIEEKFKKDHQKIGLLTCTDRNKVLFLECGHLYHESCLSNHAWAEIVDQCGFTAQPYNYSNGHDFVSDTEPDPANIEEHNRWQVQERERMERRVVNHHNRLLRELNSVDPFNEVTEQEILEAKIKCALCRNSFQIGKNEFFKELHIGSELGNTHFSFLFFL